MPAQHIVVALVGGPATTAAALSAKLIRRSIETGSETDLRTSTFTSLMNLSAVFFFLLAPPPAAAAAPSSDGVPAVSDRLWCCCCCFFFDSGMVEDYYLFQVGWN